MKRNLTVLVLMAVFCLAGCSSSAGVSPDNTSESAITVDVITAKTEEVDAALAYKGTIMPSEFAVVSTKASGKVEQILFENGDIVKEGDPLIIMDATDYKLQLAQARSQYQMTKSQADTAKAALNTVKINYDRMKTLYSEGAVSKADYESIEMSYKKALADVTSANSGIQSVNASIAMLNDIIANTVVKAPISGMVDEKAVVLGQFAAPEAGALAMLKVTTPIHAIIQVQQDDITSIKEGQIADVVFDGKHYEGTVKAIDASASLEARAFNVKIEIPNENRELKPGVFVEVAVSTSAKRNSIMIPIQALSGEKDNYFVFINVEGTARKVGVETGIIKGNSIEILSGIKEGDQIITSNLNTIQDGYVINTKEGA